MTASGATPPEKDLLTLEHKLRMYADSCRDAIEHTNSLMHTKILTMEHLQECAAHWKTGRKYHESLEKVLAATDIERSTASVIDDSFWATFDTMFRSALFLQHPSNDFLKPGGLIRPPFDNLKNKYEERRSKVLERLKSIPFYRMFLESRGWSLGSGNKESFLPPSEDKRRQNEFDEQGEIKIRVQFASKAGRAKLQIDGKYVGRWLKPAGTRCRVLKQILSTGKKQLAQSDLADDSMESPYIKRLVNDLVTREPYSQIFERPENGYIRRRANVEYLS